MVILVLGSFDEFERKSTPLYYVIGENQDECEKKFVTKVLDYHGDDYKERLKSWLSMWRTTHLINESQIIE